MDAVPSACTSPVAIRMEIENQNVGNGMHTQKRKIRRGCREALGRVRSQRDEGIL